MQVFFRFTAAIRTHHQKKYNMPIFLKPSLSNHTRPRSRFSLQALRFASGLSATIGARACTAVPCGSLSLPYTSSATPQPLPPANHRRRAAACWASLMAAHLLLALGVAAQSATTTTTDTAMLGNTTIKFVSTTAGPQAGVQFLHVHQNEATAVTAAHAMLARAKKGQFVTWQCQQDRYVQFSLNGQTFKFDPNRIYTDAGATATLKSNGPFTPQALAALRTVAQRFASQYANGKRLVVALHNNTDAGGLTINSYAKNGDYAAEAEAVNISKKWDEDDFFYTTNRHLFQYFAQKGFNIVLQNNATVTDDGSLSVYAAKNGIHYLNVEAQHGHLKQQQKMLQAVQQLIAEQYR
ncbi:MAG: hypothetical protein EAY75_04420 [Bacteroidetes bacterium]|nr:MAG: hypothetical protein EAY75_04420 [Bacteroidota bacterium]